MGALDALGEFRHAESMTLRHVSSMALAALAWGFLLAGPWTATPTHAFVALGFGGVLGAIAGGILFWRGRVRPHWSGLLHTVALCAWGIGAMAYLQRGNPLEDRYSAGWTWPMASFLAAMALPLVLFSCLREGKRSAGLQAVCLAGVLTAYPFAISHMNALGGTLHVWAGLLWCLAWAGPEQLNRWIGALWRSSLGWPIVAGAAIAGGNVLFGGAPFLAAAEFHRWGLYVAIGLLLAAVLEDEPSPTLGWLATGLAGSFGLFGIVQLFLNYQERGALYVIRERLWILGMHPNIVATVALLSAGLLWRLGGGKTRPGLGLWAATLGLGVTFAFAVSKGAILGVALATALELVARMLRGGFRQRQALALVAVPIIALTSLGVSLEGAARRDSLDTRRIAWTSAVLAWQEYPLLGQGVFNHLSLSRFADDLGPAYAERFRIWQSYGNRGAHAHSILFEALQSAGLLGALWLGWCLWLFWRGVGKAPQGPWWRTAVPRVALGAFLIHQLFDCTFFLSAPFAMAALLVGALASLPPASPSRPVGAPILIGAALLMVAWPGAVQSITSRPGLRADETLRLLCWIDPLSPVWHISRGDRTFKAGDTEAAIGHFAAASYRQPHWPEWRTRLAVAKRKQGDLEGALADLEKAVALDPYACHGDRAFLHRASLLKELGREEAFRQALAEVVVLSPRAVAAVAWKEPLGLRMLERFDYVLAPEIAFSAFASDLYEEYESLRESDPDQAQFHISGMQELLWRAGEYQGLATLCKQAGLSPLTPLRSQSGFISARRVMTLPGWKAFEAEERRRRYDDFIATGRRQAAEDDFDRSLASFLLAAELEPARPDAYRYLSGLCRAKDWRNEADYFAALHATYEAMAER